MSDRATKRESLARTFLILAVCLVGLAACDSSSRSGPGTPDIGGGLAGVMFPVGDDPLVKSMPSPWTVTQEKVGSHLGADISIAGAADVGKVVRALYSGRVILAGDFSGWGGAIAVRCEASKGAPFNLPGGGTATVIVVVFGHVRPYLKVGDLVTAGAPVGEIEALRPGVASSGPHLHLEIVDGAAVDDGRATLPGPGYSTTPSVVSVRFDPIEFLALNERPASKLKVETLRTFNTPAMDVVVATVDECFVSERGTIAGTTGAIWRVNYRTGAASKLVDNLFLPGHLALHASKDLLLCAVQGEDRIIAIDLRTNAVTTVVSGATQVAGVAVDEVSSRYVFSTAAHQVFAVPFAGGLPTVIAGTGAPGFSGDGGDPRAAQLTFPGDLVAAGGEVYFADAGQRVRVLKRGLIDTVTDEVSPKGLAFDNGGNLWIAAGSHQVVKDLDGVLLSIVGQPNAPGTRDGVAFEALLDDVRDVAIAYDVILVATDERVLVLQAAPR